ncbi:N-acetyltransferase [Pelomonas sp. KK5]|uniref:GNAT family N-acetyltransferase n=1 Tax=Pelomonas sp. KK5 TaxID=1855730 RepID=UPI001E4A6A57|nr:GNAT family N-acetyltransferase [Pelomonas sp. KK5]
MVGAEFDAWLGLTIPAFATQKIASGQWAAREALALSIKAHEELLPQGLATPDNHFFIVQDEAGGRVGMLWFAEQARGAERIAYLYNIEIDEAQQRRGHARRAMQGLEQQVRERGLAGISLHVFGHNTGAQALYTGLGFQPTNITMFKPVA